jgi:peptide/nickel transport system permease protein
MIRQVVRRCLWAAVVVWAVVTLTFAIDQVLPGDPARMVTGPQARPEEVARVRAQLGLDAPIGERYARFLERLAHLAPLGDPKPEGHDTCATVGPLHIDLGRSYVQRRPVMTILGERLPRTAALAAAAVLLQTLLGVALGTAAAVRQGTARSGAVMAATFLGSSAPTFLVGLLLQYVFAQRLGWLPLDGFGKTPGAQALALILPASTLGLFGTSFSTRLVRDEVSAQLARDHVRTARAKGGGAVRVLLRHALRNALAPLLTLAGLDFGATLGGSVVVETLFRWPGLGSVAVNAMLDRDGPLVLGTVLATSLAVVTASLVVDLTYPWIDPRARATRDR